MCGFLEKSILNRVIPLFSVSPSRVKQTQSPTGSLALCWISCMQNSDQGAYSGVVETLQSGLVYVCPSRAQHGAMWAAHKKVHSPCLRGRDCEELDRGPWWQGMEKAAQPEEGACHWDVRWAAWLQGLQGSVGRGRLMKWVSSIHVGLASHAQDATLQQSGSSEVCSFRSNGIKLAF